MYIAEGVDDDTRASMLVRQLIDEHDPNFGVGSMTCSVYDTAWVSMVAKTSGGQTKWLFPGCFHYLLGHQQHDGGWVTSGADGDAILNTLAALLALCKHIAAPHQLIYIPQEELLHKKDRAIYFLEAKFSQWDVSLTTSQNFELLIPKLLHLLQQEGTEFTFPGRELLSQLNGRALARFNPATLYTNVRNRFTHCLEGFVGEIDFDRVSQHKISGSMMASPASTAAYLMNCSTWDDGSETYLVHVTSIGDESSNGGVPSRYPSTVFELTTTLSVLLENGFKPVDLSMPHLDNAATFLEDCLNLENGVTGFAPYVESDADNTARAISTLSLLGRTCSPRGLIIRYETREFFKTYTQDRNPNLRTNCLVLKALLDIFPQNQEQMPQIETTVKFISNCWWTTNGQAEDSQNVSSNYATMLMVQAFTRLVDLYDQSLTPVLNDDTVRDKVALCLFQALTQTLQSQNPDGSWGRGQRCETTAYALLTLAKITALSLAPRIKAEVSQAIENGKRYLTNHFRPQSEPDRVWKDKITSGSRIMFQAYILAALRVPDTQLKSQMTIESRYEISLAKIAIQSKYYSKQPWFASFPEWQIQAFLVESQLFLPQLKLVQYAVFPQDTQTEDQYFDSIPFIWIAAGTVDRRFIGPEYLYQMMILAFLNRQLQDYISNVLGEVFSGCLFEVSDVIHGIFDELKFDQKDQCFCDGHAAHPHRSSISTTGTVSMSEARSVLYRYISHIMNHPYVLMASHHDQDQLRSELLQYLLGRIEQRSESENSSGIEERALARTTGSSSPDHTPHQLTFAFLSCMVGNQTPNGAVGLRRDFLNTPEQQYLVADLCRRLSILSFLSNSGLAGAAPEAPYREPYLRSGSTSFIDAYRESFQSSVSSASRTSSTYSRSSSPVSPVSSISSAPSRSPTGYVDDKLAGPVSGSSNPQDPEQSLQLRRLLTHERRCLNTCMESLAEAETNLRTLNVLRLFIDVSELSEQIFSDPNAKSHTADGTHRTNGPSLKEEIHMSTPPPLPPRRAERRGSVSAARAALEIAPLQPKRNSREQSQEHHVRSQSSDCTPRSDSFLTTTERLIRAAQDDIKLTGTTHMQREWNFNKTNKMMHHRKASKSSIEVNRIERIMADIDGGKKSNPDLPIHPALRTKISGDLSGPKINQMLAAYPVQKHKASSPSKSSQSTTNEQLERNITEALDARMRASSSNNTNATNEKTRRGRAGSSRQKQHDSRVRARHEAEENQRQRATSLQNQGMAEAAIANTGIGTPFKPATLPSPTFTQTRSEKSPKPVLEPSIPLINKAATFPPPPFPPPPAKNLPPPPKKTISLNVKPWAPPPAWVKAPNPVNNDGEAALEVERVGRMRKSRRASRLGGPRWRAPF